MARAHWRLKGSCAFDYLLVESTAISEPLHAAESRFGRRTVLTFPLPPVPHKNSIPKTSEDLRTVAAS